MKTTESSRYWRIAGFRVTIDPLLPVVILLIGWLLSERYFPQFTIGYIPVINYILGGIASVLLTFSILFHELGHALTAVRLKLSIERIHLFLFGGMAELKQRPHTPRQEFLIATSGPLFSFILAGILWLSHEFVLKNHDLVSALMIFLIQINILLGFFNLIPIFPLDGGRAIRSLYWRLFRKYAKASRITLYTSSALIATILIAGFTDLMFFRSSYEIVVLLLAGYLGYTVFNSRRELLQNPLPVDFVHPVNPEYSYINLIREVTGSPNWSLRDTIIPMDATWRSDGGRIIHGQHLYNALILKQLQYEDLQNGSVDNYITNACPGDYIELTVPDTFHSGIEFTAEITPLYKSGILVGLCDAHETRFWLHEHQSDDLTSGLMPQDSNPMPGRPTSDFANPVENQHQNPE